MSKLENVYAYSEAVREFTQHRDRLMETTESGYTVRVLMDRDARTMVVGVFDTYGHFRMGFDLK